MAPLLIHIQRWLKLPKVWRFIGFVSALVGMLCFALSSSFNSLFGEWYLLKTFLYGIFSFIICLAVLFANTWQHSRSLSLRLEAHMAFLVLTITSFYSFFFDKAVKGKPDAYSLVACASFAVMSLSLSIQIHCGFEVDLLYFFLGALIVQLMKIRWLLGISGVGFSYFLIVLRSCIGFNREANIYMEPQDQSQVVIEVDSLPVQSDDNSGATTLVVTAQDHAITEVNSHSNQASAYTELIKPQLLASMKALKKNNRKLISLLHGQYPTEFFELLNDENPFLLTDEHDHNFLIDALPSEIINNLNQGIKLSVAAGFEKECCHLYSLGRREFLRQFLSTLELDDLNREHKHEDTALKQERVSRWTKAFEFFLLRLFPKEQRLCERVFHGFSSIGYLSFVLICNEVTIHLLRFAETFAVQICSSQNLEDVITVFTKLSEVIPKMESLFPDQSRVPLRNEAIRVRKRLGEAIRGTFTDLGNLILCDTTVAVPAGIYSSTRYVMECLIIAMRYRISIEHIFKVYPNNPIVANGEEMFSSLFTEMDGVMELLDSNLEAKSKIYKEAGLGYVSMMNNIMYIKQHMKILSLRNGKAKLSWVDHICSKDQIQKHTAKVQQSLEDYLRSSWNEVLGFLKLDSNDEFVASGVAAESMKKRLKLFNTQFDEICRVQSKWFASADVRKEIMMSIENMLLPAYGNFIGRFQDVLGKHAYEYIQYGMFDIRARLDRLFLSWKQVEESIAEREGRATIASVLVSFMRSDQNHYQSPCIF